MKNNIICLRGARNIFVALTLILSFTGLHAQAPFQKLYESGGTEEGTGMDAISQGLEYVLTGNRKLPTDPSDIILLKADTSGNTSNAALLRAGSSGHTEIARDVKSDPFTNWGLAGEIMDSGDSESDALMIRTDASGSILWSKRYGDGSRSEGFNALCPALAFGYCAVGYSGNLLSQGADDDAFITLANSTDGAQICAKTFGGNSDEAMNDVIEITGTANYCAVGWTESFGMDGKGIYVVTIDSACNKLWSLTVDGTGDDIAYAIAQDSSSIAITGQTNSFGTGGRWNTFLLRISPTGGMLGFQIFENTNVDDGARSIDRIGNNGGFIISGRTLDQDSISWMMRLDQFYQLDWYKQYKGVVCSDVEEFATGSYFYSLGRGLGAGASTEDLFLVHADANGSTPASCNDLSLTPTMTALFLQQVAPPDTILSMNFGVDANITSNPLTVASQDACNFVGLEEEILQGVSLYPKPAAEAIFAELEFERSATTVIRLTDLQGRVLMEKDLGEISEKRLEIDLSGFAPGIYLFEVYSDAGRSVQRFVKE